MSNSGNTYDEILERFGESYIDATDQAILQIYGVLSKHLIVHYTYFGASFIAILAALYQLPKVDEVMVNSTIFGRTLLPLFPFFAAGYFLIRARAYSIAVGKIEEGINLDFIYIEVYLALGDILFDIQCGISRNITLIHL